MDNWYKPNTTSFIVQNISTTGKKIRIFNYPIAPGATRDLLKIPGITESDIRASLLKGDLYKKILKNQITIIRSNINLTQFDATQKEFLKSAGLTTGTNITISDIGQGEGIYNSAWDIDVWHIDGTNGNDNNDGLTELTALKTCAGLINKIGINPVWNHNTTIYIYNTISDELNLNYTASVPFIKLNIIGIPTVIKTGTVTTWTNFNRSTNTPSKLTSNDITDWTPYINKRIRLGTEVLQDDDLLGWVDTCNRDSTGVNVASVCYWYNPKTWDVYPDVSDPFVIEDLPTIPSIKINAKIDTTYDTVSYDSTRVFISDIHIADLFVDITSVELDPSIQVVGCKIDGSITIPHPISISLFSCYLAIVYYLFYGEIMGGVVRAYDGWSSIYINTPGPALNISWALFSVGIRLNAKASLSLSDVTIIDAPTHALHIGHNANLILSWRIIGRNNNGYGLYAKAGAKITRDFTSLAQTYTTVTGSSGEVYLESVNKTLNWTWPFRDGVISGITTLNAGSKDITVPLFDSTRQQVLVTYDTPGPNGTTPLSVPVASKTATGFTITNGQATDSASTVSWVTTPLGSGVQME